MKRTGDKRTVPLSQVSTPGTNYNFTYNAFGQRTQVAVGNWYLANYWYESRTNLLSRLDYHNGDSVRYTYDTKGRLIQETYEDNAAVYYGYDNSSNLATVSDSETGIVSTNYYDLTDRLMKYTEEASGFSHSVAYTYDTLNNMTGLTEVIDGHSSTTSYTYDKDNRIVSSTDGTTDVNYTYDGYGRVYSKITKCNGAVVKSEIFTYEYLPGTEYASTQIATHLVSAGGIAQTYHYEYDLNGNITKISREQNNETTLLATYAYDSQNQLIRENDPISGTTQVWTYDANGNILTHYTYAYSESNSLYNAQDIATYGYNDPEWGDWLSSYRYSTFQNDEIGNLINEGGRWFYNWKHGRQLESMSNGTTTWSFTYDANGMRTKRTNGTDTYRYVYNGGKLSRMTKGSDTLYFTYDPDGTPLTLTHNGTVYYYITNIQGDVIAITNTNGNRLVNYTYDAWGNPYTPTGILANTLGYLNPLRYRGYVYDWEVELYYLQSRYYSHDFCRFISPDAFVSTGQGFVGNNMFAYCNNNPVICADHSGTDAIILLDNDFVGHLGIMAQDADGAWWHFYWGAISSSYPLTIIGCNLPVTTWCVEYSGMLNLESINDAKQYFFDYEYFAYIPGDFSSCIAEMKNPTGKYNLYTNNCSQKSLSILASANTSYQGALSKAANYISPKTAYFYAETRIAFEMGKEEAVLIRLLPKRPIRIPIIGGTYAHNV